MHGGPRGRRRFRTLAAVALYAAYGSNLDPRQMAERAPTSPPRGTGWIAGWRLTFGGEEHGWDGALATVAEDAEGQVFAMLYEVSAVDEAGLDQWEGSDLGLYRKLRVRVHALDGDVTAWMYVLDAYEGGLPSARTVGIIAEAAEFAGAPKDYVEQIRNRPCRSSGL